ncbi:MAG: phosphodiester glycosidase family protein [Bacillota bacterium]|nr:phosphodiester glycosidase family protein [Bacillota bacterium]
MMDITNKNEKAKRKRSYKTIIFCIIFEMVFTLISAPLILFYGPFQHAKKIAVGTINITMHRKYLKYIYSQKQIDEILGNGKSSSEKMLLASKTTDEKQNLDDVKVPTKHDDTIIRYNVSGTKFDGYMLEVKDATRVKVGYTNKLNVEGERTSQIAEDHNAIAAINGGGFLDETPDGKWIGTGAYPMGLLMSGGKLINGDENEYADVMGLTEKGQLIVGQYNAKKLKNLGVTEAIAFGPAIIINGKPQIYGEGSLGVNPRTAIGQKKDGTILLLVIDGRQLDGTSGLKIGATMGDVQKTLLDHGAWNATNLDGGSSSTMYYEGEVINNPCDWSGERSVSSAIYVEP